MYDSLEFIIACGGYSTRNYPHSKTGAHKSLMPFGDVRFIDFVLKDIIKSGGRHITIVCSNQHVVDVFKKALSRDEATELKLRRSGRTMIADVLQSTFLPADVDLKFVIQDKPLGTAHVLGLAHRVSPDRHGVLIFPDDIIVSKNAERPFIRKMAEDFFQNDHQILLTGRRQADVSNNAIIDNGRLVEKPKTPVSDVAGYSPIILPKAVMDFIEAQTTMLEKGESLPNKAVGSEWVYVDGINAFLDQHPAGSSYTLKMFMLSGEEELLDTGTLPLYELAQLYALLNLSVFKEKNRAYVQTLLNQNS